MDPPRGGGYDGDLMFPEMVEYYDRGSGAADGVGAYGGGYMGGPAASDYAGGRYYEQAHVDGAPSHSHPQQGRQLLPPPLSQQSMMMFGQPRYGEPPPPQAHVSSSRFGAGYGLGAPPLPPPPPLRGSFETKIFKGRYQRNNKRGGLKNLRCFPSCGFRHKESGFCGRSVEVEVDHPSGLSTSGFRMWVEFVRRNDSPSFAPGERVPLQRLQQMERSKEEPIKPLVRGERLDEKCTDTVSAFEFNKERRGWHYGWASNKHTCNAEHALQCYVFQPTADPSQLLCRLVFQSPTFMLFCRRRRRFTLAPSAPNATPSRRGQKKAATAEDGEEDGEEEEEGDGEEEEEEEEDEEEAGPPAKPKAEPKAKAKATAASKGKAAAGAAEPEVAAAAAGKATAKTKAVTVKRERPDSGAGSPAPPSKRAAGDGHGPSPVQPTVVVSAAGRKRQLGSGAAGAGAAGAGAGTGDTSKMEGVMRRVAVIMNLLAQQDSTTGSSNGYGGSWAENGAQGGAARLAGSLMQDMPEFLGGAGGDLDMVNLLSQWGDTASFSGSVGFGDDDFGPLTDDAPPPPPELAEHHQQEHQLHELPSLKRTTSEAMMDDVAKYMRNESGFERALEQLRTKSRSGAPNTFGFLKLVQEHLDSYRRSRNISRTEFDRVFNKAAAKLTPGQFPMAAVTAATSVSAAAAQRNAASAASAAARPAPPERSSGGLLSSAFGALSSLVGAGASSAAGSAASIAARRREEVAALPLTLTAPGGVVIPNIQGHWKQTQEAENAMQELRYKMGTPWILSKMFEFMEHRFEIEVNAGECEMVTRLSRKWISNTTMRFTLDGESHHWGISLPAPFSQLSQGWSYRAWVQENKIVLIHTIGDQQLTRVHWLSRDRAKLHSTVVLEVLEQGRWVEMGRCQQDAEREY
jgi:hypothetical protein